MIIYFIVQQAKNAEKVWCDSSGSIFSLQISDFQWKNGGERYESSNMVIAETHKTQKQACKNQQ